MLCFFQRKKNYLQYAFFFLLEINDCGLWLDLMAVVVEHNGVATLSWGQLRRSWDCSSWEALRQDIFSLGPQRPQRLCLFYWFHFYDGSKTKFALFFIYFFIWKPHLILWGLTGRPWLVLQTMCKHGWIGGLFTLIPCISFFAVQYLLNRLFALRFGSRLL